MENDKVDVGWSRKMEEENFDVRNESKLMMMASKKETNKASL